MLIDKRPYDDREVDVNGRAKRLYMGGDAGWRHESLWRGAGPAQRPGFSAGEVLRQAHPSRDLGLADFATADLEPYYTEAEQLYGVAGRGEEDFGPLQKPAVGYPGEPLPLHPSTSGSSPPIAVHGLHPFRLPLAIDSSRCLRCGVCAGYICPTGARSSSAQLLERAIAEGLSHQDPDSGRSGATGQRNAAAEPP